MSRAIASATRQGATHEEIRAYIERFKVRHGRKPAPEEIERCQYYPYYDIKRIVEK